MTNDSSMLTLVLTRIFITTSKQIILVIKYMVINEEIKKLKNKFIYELFMMNIMTINLFKIKNKNI